MREKSEKTGVGGWVLVSRNCLPGFPRGARHRCYPGPGRVSWAMADLVLIGLGSGGGCGGLFSAIPWDLTDFALSTASPFLGPKLAQCNLGYCRLIVSQTLLGSVVYYFLFTLKANPSSQWWRVFRQGNRSWCIHYFASKTCLIFKLNCLEVKKKPHTWIN